MSHRRNFPGEPPIPSGISIVLEVLTVVAVIVAIVSARFALAAGLVALLGVFALLTERALKHANSRRDSAHVTPVVNSTSERIS